MKPMTIPALLLALTLPGLALATPQATSDGAGPRPVHPASASSSAGHGRVLVSVSIISYPGVPERSSCRMLFRAVNETGQPVELATLLHTYDSFRADQNSWLVPTGTMAPGQQIERLYSCKGASFLSLDKRSGHGWPTICAVNGEELRPCPVALQLDSNVKILKPE
mgnify:CR=1 FL=1